MKGTILLRLLDWARGDLGGDEFVVLLRNISMIAAAPVLQRVDDVVRDDEALRPMTVYAGALARSARLPDVGALLHGADAALYEAKRQGAISSAWPPTEFATERWLAITRLR